MLTGQNRWRPNIASAPSCCVHHMFFSKFVRGFLRNSATFLVCADGTVQGEDCLLLELEDVAKAYKRPSIIDIKVHIHFDDSTIELLSPIHLLLVLMLLLRKEPATGPSGWRRINERHTGRCCIRVPSVSLEGWHAPAEHGIHSTMLTPDVLLQVGFKTWYPGSDARYIAKCQCVFSTCCFQFCGLPHGLCTPSSLLCHAGERLL